MAEPDQNGSVIVLANPFEDFSPGEHTSASPARVDGWSSERLAVAARSAHTGCRQGGPWGSTT
jgi:hypothetical protein